ncbi:MAG: preprotein translocase subunit SecE [Bdellovibrionaceae bacterium]|nr:preprotein translocase subunit SecE [Pseudobdellovibrionaceae bacterium]
MNKANSKILTLSFAISGAVVGFTVSLLIKAFSGAFAFVARAADMDLVRHGVPVVIGFGLFALLQFHPGILAWADEVVTEVRKVVFPSRKDTTAMTIVVIIMVFVSSLIITSFDFISAYFIKAVIS